MDPYLEGHLWPDVHQALAAEIRRQIASRVRPKYVVRLATTTIHDPSPESDIGIMYPDVEVLHRTTASWSGATPMPAQRSATPLVISEAVDVPLLDFQVKVVTVEVYDALRDQLVTSIELLSPVNKREPGLSSHRQKQARLRDAGVHLLEIDLIRRGQRPVVDSRLLSPQLLLDASYLVTLERAGAARLQAWPLRLDQRLPVVAVPLRMPDPDVPLDLATALAVVYIDAAYDLSVDYTQDPPPPPLSGQDRAWMHNLLAQLRSS
jgi:hypothetical protein